MGGGRGGRFFVSGLFSRFGFGFGCVLFPPPRGSFLYLARCIYDGGEIALPFLSSLSLSLSLSLRSTTTTPRWGKIIYDPVPEWTSVIGPKILWQLPSFKTVDGFADRNSSFHYTRVSLERGAVFSVPRSPLCLS